MQAHDTVDCKKLAKMIALFQEISPQKSLWAYLFQLFVQTTFSFAENSPIKKLLHLNFLNHSL